MAETTVFIEEGSPRLECLVERKGEKGGVVITHPHPLYGGDMENRIVETVARVYSQKGMATLRFNFRGVGRSGGTYDHGSGEQEDVRRALAYLRDAGKRPLHLVGYSFGAWVNAMALKSVEEVDHVVAVSPPVAFMNFGEAAPDERLKLVVSGSADDLAPESMVREAVVRWNPGAGLRIVAGADHFFGGKLDNLEKILSDFLKSTIAQTGINSYK